MAHVTADDIRELLTSRILDPTLIEWTNTRHAVHDTVEVVSGALFTDISWSHRDDDYRILATANDLRQQGDWDIENPTDEDCEAFAQQINEE